jgi:hypothetical protein
MPSYALIVWPRRASEARLDIRDETFFASPRHEPENPRPRFTLPFCGVNYPRIELLTAFSGGRRITVNLTRFISCRVCGSLAAAEAEYADGTDSVNCPQCAVRVQPLELEVQDEDEQADGL